jgi:hypothetical protein
MQLLIDILNRYFNGEGRFMKACNRRFLRLFFAAGVSGATIFAGTVLAQAPKPLTTPNADIAGMETAAEQEFFVGMVAMKELCKERHPKQAMRIERNFNAKFVEAPAELKKFAMSKEFPPRVAKRVEEQREIIKQPAEATQLDATCKRLANVGRNSK